MKQYKCRRCQETRNEDEFFNCSRSKIGKRLYACKVCERKQKVKAVGVIEPLQPEGVKAFSAWIRRGLQSILK